MNFNKYNVPKDGASAIIQSVINQVNQNNNDGEGSGSRGGGGSSQSGGAAADSMNRYLWGCWDDGDDVDGSMQIFGNIYVSNEYDTNEDRDEDEDEDDSYSGHDYTFPNVFDNNNGNLYAAGIIKSGTSVQAPEVYATSSLCVPHPTTHVKTDILQLMKNYDASINANTASISSLDSSVLTLRSKVNSLDTSVKAHQSSILAIDSSIDGMSGDIQTNQLDIADLKSKINSLSSGGSGTVINSAVIWEGTTTNDNIDSNIIFAGGDEGVNGLEITPVMLDYWYDFIEYGGSNSTRHNFREDLTGQCVFELETDDETGDQYAVPVFYVTSSVIDLGYFAIDEIISVDSLFAQQIDGNVTLINIQSGYTLYRDNTTTAVAGSIGPSLSYTVHTAGHYYVKLWCSGNWRTGSFQPQQIAPVSTVLDASISDLKRPINGLVAIDTSTLIEPGLIRQRQATVSVKCYYYTQVFDTKVKLCPDGLSINNNSVRCILCPDGFYFKAGNYQLRISSEGIKAYKNGTAVSLV